MSNDKSERRTGGPSLLERLERHPLKVFLVLCSGIASATYGVTHFLFQQKAAALAEQHQREVARLEGELARFSHGLSLSSHFDVSQIVVPASECNSLPDETHYFSFDGFYAPQGNGDWAYEETSENAVAHMITGETYEGTGLEQAASLVPVHLWSAETLFEVEHEGVRTRLRPMIMLQRFPVPKLQQLLGATPDNGSVQLASFESAVRDNNKITKASSSDGMVGEPKSLFDSMLEDLTGRFFQFHMWLELGATLESPGTSFRLERVQKSEDLLYTSSRTVFSNAVVNGKALPEFNVHSEMILASTPRGLYMIKIVIPSPEPILRESDAAKINQWLLNLKILDR